ncbi:hypothetical protein TNCV_1074581 [Trichonephila clavipes]|uniref:Uncharacterized protein n=1 Tax=Trichonephila clavipes TaxID=2585209 RepID=A0A8X6VQG3_TRICX|nr:hypothetical protein TNCV_1074581 [Trichonephila clavipes]
MYDACRRQIYRPISQKEQVHHSSAGGKSVSCCLRKADLPKNCCQTFEEEGLYARRPVVCVPLTDSTVLPVCNGNVSITIGLNRTGHAYYSRMSRFSLSSVVDAN